MGTGTKAKSDKNKHEELKTATGVETTGIKTGGGVNAARSRVAFDAKPLNINPFDAQPAVDKLKRKSELELGLHSIVLSNEWRASVTPVCSNSSAKEEQGAWK